MTITLQDRNAYSEVFELMKYIDRKDLSKIPMDILEAIKENRNEEYVPKIDLENVNKSLSKDARALYIGLYKEYIVQDEKERQAINKAVYDNKMKRRNEIKYEIFNKEKVNEEMVKEKEIEQNKNLVVYKENFLTRIINRIKLLFRSGGNKSGN